MASSSSLLRPSTLAPASSPPLPRRPQLGLRSSPRRPRGVSLTVAAAASPDVQKEPSSSPPAPPDEPSDLSAVAESVKVLKDAAKTRKVPAAEVLAQDQEGQARHLGLLRDVRRDRVPRQDMDAHLHRPSKLEKGSYFPVTAVQRFDAAGQRIENGVYLGPAGSLTFEGRLSWKKKILAFVFERVRVKLGPLGSLEIPFGSGDKSREPSTKDPFFLWFYVDEEIAVAQGKGGGIAFWCRCKRVPA